MKKNFRLLSAVLSASVLLSSCVGSFSLTNKLIDWNQTVGNKFVNELVFLACNIIPVYGVCWLADALVINSIEFWTGSNPVASVGSVKNIETETGNYAIETKENGYTITKEGEESAIEFVFDATSKTWSMESEGVNSKLMTIVSDEEVTMYLPTGEEMNVSLDQAGMMAFKQVSEGFASYAAR